MKACKSTKHYQKDLHVDQHLQKQQYQLSQQLKQNKELKNYINKELRKAIYDRSRLRNRFCKTPTEENEKFYENKE